MKLTASQIKGRVKNLAIKNNIDPRILLRIYMMERFLERISVSKYKDNFILKGGMLLTSIVGNSFRTTMDIDTSINGFKLDEQTASRIIEEIASISLDDGIAFKVNRVEKIMSDMDYPGIRIHIDSIIEKMITPILIDISIEDSFTMGYEEYRYKLMLEDRTIQLYSYKLEKTLAEKLQTIMIREVLNTRMRDYYDIYIIMHLFESSIDGSLIKEAYITTCKNRHSEFLIGDEGRIIGLLEKDDNLFRLWNGYKEKFQYASNITYDQTIDSIKKLVEIINNS